LKSNVWENWGVRGDLFVDYGISGPSSFTRRVICDLAITVHRTLEGQSMDFLRLQSSKGHSLPKQGSDIATRGHSRIEGDILALDSSTAGCILTIDIRNAYGQPFDVTLEKVEDSYKCQERIEPGATASMMVPLRQITLPNNIGEKPIPSLMERQYVVPKSKLTPQELRLSRELFWCREEVLRLVKASWSEVGTLRHGTISLRSLRLTAPMMDILRSDEIRVELSLKDPGTTTQKPGLASPWNAYTTELVDMMVTVTNLSDRTLNVHTKVELLPHDDEESLIGHDLLSRYVIFDGNSSFTKTIKPYESESISVPICFLAEGTFGFGASTSFSFFPSSDGEASSSGPVVHFSQAVIIDVVER